MLLHQIKSSFDHVTSYVGVFQRRQCLQESRETTSAVTQDVEVFHEAQQKKCTPMSDKTRLNHLAANMTVAWYVTCR